MPGPPEPTFPIAKTLVFSRLACKVKETFWHSKFSNTQFRKHTWHILIAFSSPDEMFVIVLFPWNTGSSAICHYSWDINAKWLCQQEVQETLVLAHFMVATEGEIGNEPPSSIWPCFLISAPTPADGVFEAWTVRVRVPCVHTYVGITFTFLRIGTLWRQYI